MNKLVPMLNWLAVHENRAYFFTAAQDRPKAWGSSYCKPFSLERFFFVQEPESNSRSIPADVAADKAVNAESSAGVGRQAKAHPPSVTEPALGFYEEEVTPNTLRSRLRTKEPESLFRRKSGHEVKGVSMKKKDVERRALYYSRREREIAWAKARHKKHPERARIANRKYHWKHREKILAKKRQYRRNHPEVLRQQTRNYRATERGKSAKAAADHNRRVRKEGRFSNITTADIERIKNESGGRCFYCRKVRPLTIDHYEPLYLGGKHILENLVCACGSCNSRKHIKRASDFLREFGRLL